MGKPGNSKRIGGGVNNIGGSVGGGGNNTTVPPTVTVSQTVTQPQQQPITNVQMSASPLTGKSQNPNFTNGLDLNAMHQQQVSKNINANIAEQMYLSPRPIQGSQYSFSQELNYAMETGKKLDVDQQFAVDNLQKAMIPIGQDTTLVRMVHQDYLQQLGIVGNYQNMSDQQLANALVGRKYQNNALASTTADIRALQRHAAPLSEKEVQLNIHAHQSTRAFAINPKTGQQEVVLGVGNTWEVTGARFAKDSRGRRQQGRWKANYYDKVEIDIDVYYQ